jgi:glutamine cyclotransferase
MLVLAALLLTAPTSLFAQQCGEPAPLRFDVSSRIVRSQAGFTQGLEWRDGKLYESTGRVGGTTRLNVISPTGQVTTLADLGDTVFGEGLTILNDEVVQLTWQEREVFVYDLAGKLKRRMRNPRDGWGLSNDGTQLIFTDGGDSLHFVDPKSFAIRKSVKIRSGRAGAVNGVNELEFVGGKLYGNIFTTWAIVRIDPATGCVDAVADLRSLLAIMTPDEKAQINGENVLNGIAHDEKSGLFYITGKRWKSIFVGRFSEGAR